MKIAILTYGEYRTAKHAVQSWNILNTEHEIDVYVHTQNKSDDTPISEKDIRDLFPNVSECKIWLEENVQRGPAIWYQDPVDNVDRLYISDFLIDNTIYEIKSSWTWNKHGKDEELEMRNKKKLTSCIDQGYNVILVLNGEEIDAATLD